MSTQDVLMGFVVDRSGSMASLVAATIEGFNKVLNDQKNEPGEAFLSLTLFDHSLDIRYVAQPLAEVPDMSAFSGPNAYTIGGSTALLDAVGTTIKGVEKWQASHPEFTGQVKIVILTDGYENSSTTWHLNHPPKDGDAFDVGGLIRWKQTEGWEFIFLGAGGSGWLEKTFGDFVMPDAFLGYDRDNHAAAYVGTSAALTRSRATGQSVSSSTSHLPINTSTDAKERRKKPVK